MRSLPQIFHGAVIVFCVAGQILPRQSEDRIDFGLVHADPEEVEDLAPPPIEDRLAALMRMRQESIQPVALETIRAWRVTVETPEQEDESSLS